MESHSLLESISFQQWVTDTSYIQQLTFIASQTLIESNSSWGNNSILLPLLESYEAASEALEADSRGYFPKPAKYLAQGSYLLHHDSSFHNLAIDRLGRVFSEALPSEIKFYIHRIESILKDSPVDCVQVFLHGLLQLPAEMCLDPENDDLLTAQSMHMELIEEIENHLFNAVTIAFENSLLDVIPHLTNLGSDTLLIRIYDWLLKYHPEIFQHFPLQEDVETYLLHHDYFVQFFTFPHI